MERADRFADRRKTILQLLFEYLQNHFLNARTFQNKHRHKHMFVLMVRHIPCRVKSSTSLSMQGLLRHPIICLNRRKKPYIIKIRRQNENLPAADCVFIQFPCTLYWMHPMISPFQVHQLVPLS